MGKKRWPVRTITDMLSNEKYTGDSFYKRTLGTPFPVVKRIKNDPDKVQRTRNHHPPIINKETFYQAQEMKKMRSNIEIDEQGNRVRKTTHYSMKQSITIA
jgi:hypothetical protein